MIHLTLTPTMFKSQRSPNLLAAKLTNGFQCFTLIDRFYFKLMIYDADLTEYILDHIVYCG